MSFTNNRHFFEDLEVVRTVDRHVFTVDEVMELIDRQPNVKTTVLHCDPPRHFSIDTLAYPQYASRYKLTVAEWADLVAYVKGKLEEGIATDEVLDHWRSIVNGTPPFGLQVQPGLDSS